MSASPGNSNGVAADAELGSLDYGAEHLHIPLLVLGHQHCGAVTAAGEGGEAIDLSVRWSTCYALL